MPGRKVGNFLTQTKRNRFNTIGFEPVTTDGLRIEVELQHGHSGGILEWKVE